MSILCLDSNIRVERDLKQKRQLVADLRNKLNEEKENSHQIKAKVVRQNLMYVFLLYFHWDVILEQFN